MFFGCLKVFLDESNVSQAKKAVKLQLLVLESGCDIEAVLEMDLALLVSFEDQVGDA